MKGPAPCPKSDGKTDGIWETSVTSESASLPAPFKKLPSPQRVTVAAGMQHGAFIVQHELSGLNGIFVDLMICIVGLYLFIYVLGNEPGALYH